MIPQGTEDVWPWPSAVAPHPHCAHPPPWPDIMAWLRPNKACGGPPSQWHDMSLHELHGTSFKPMNIASKGDGGPRHVHERPSSRICPPPRPLQSCGGSIYVYTYSTMYTNHISTSYIYGHPTSEYLTRVFIVFEFTVVIWRLGTADTYSKAESAMPGALDRGTLVGVDNYFRVTSICECIGAQSLSSRYLLNPVVLTMYCCDKCLNPALFKR